jgi:1-acyl-sn-glycerol-3-phosphate acyltransferase
MKKIIAYPLSVIYYLMFGLTLVFFHAIQCICFNLSGYIAHKKSVDAMLFFLIANTFVLGTRYKISGLNRLPAGVPLIIVSNHQSLYDIMAIGWFMRQAHPKYISKMELGKGIPGLSYNLTHGGSVLINRKDSRQSLSAIRQMAQYIETNQRAAVLFPEGTRSKTGRPAPFAENGLKILCKYALSAYIVPVTINNSWKMAKWGAFPVGVGNKIELTVHTPMRICEQPFDELFKKTEQVVTQSIYFQ